MESKTQDQRWFVPRASLDPHPASRFADPYDPDRPPMPPDDPIAHVDMHAPNGMKGYKHWHRDGDASWIANPEWGLSLELNEDGTLFLSRDRAVELALLHSRQYQLELEELYLTCLDLTLERFQFDTQWSFSNFTQFFHFGNSSTPDEVNSLTTSTSLGFRRAFSAGGQLIAEFSNTLVWQFTGTDTTAGQSNLAVTLVQPLLRDAGRNIQLEALTQSERNVFYAARDFARFRKQFYFDVVSGDGGYLSLLLLVQNVRNFEANLVALEVDLRTHEALADAGLMSRIQVDQVFQGYQNGRLALVRAQNQLQTEMDTYKIRLGLPPDVPITLDDSLLQPFEFNDPTIDQIQKDLEQLLSKYREFDQAPDGEELRRGLNRLAEFKPPLAELVEQIYAEVQRARAVPLPQLTDEQRQVAVQYRVETLQANEGRLIELRSELEKLLSEIQNAKGAVTEEGGDESWELLQKLIRRQLGFAAELFVIQNRVRVYLVELQNVDMDPEFAVQVALESRLDLLNQRAFVVDAWRRIQVTANRLKSDLDVTVGANLSTDRDSDNPFDFAAETSSYRAGFRFDGPLNRKAERNAYRAQLIRYQRSRRSYMALEDRVIQEIRRDLRDLSTGRINFEIARQSLISAARQVEMARDQLLLPGPASDSSQTQDTLIALNSFLQAKNALISIWVDYETTRLQLLLDLEALQPDPSQEPINVYATEPAGNSEPEVLPPPVHVEQDE